MNTSKCTIYALFDLVYLENSVRMIDELPGEIASKLSSKTISDVLIASDS
ncbi:MAG: hypothetical protein AAF719_00350 [Pseudomonadota bacterium]